MAGHGCRAAGITAAGMPIPVTVMVTDIPDMATVTATTATVDGVTAAGIIE
jgi:hypothetical protein